MHTSEPQWITFESSMHTLTGCGENITENDKKYEPKKIHINMTKEQHEKMYKMFMAKKMANQRRQMEKRHFKQQVGEIRGQYVDSTVIHELKEHKTDNEDNEYEEKYKKIVDQTDYMFDKDMTTRDVIELFMMSKNDSQLDKLDFTNILPQETSNINYYISYFVACLKNGKTELLPFIVKIHENPCIMSVSEFESESKNITNASNIENNTTMIMQGGGSIPIKSTYMIKTEKRESASHFKGVHKKVNQMLCEKIMMKLRNYRMEIKQVFIY